MTSNNHWLVAAFVVGLCGCSQGTEPNSVVGLDSVAEVARDDPRNHAEDASESNSQPESMPTVRSNDKYVFVPAEWRFPGVHSIQTADSWDARLSMLPPDQRARLRELNERYLGALSFDSAEDQKRMAEQGFPMPEEWLASERMSDAELLSLAQAGNHKAILFQVDRVSRQVGSVLAERGGLDTTLSNEREMLSKLAKAKNMNEELLAATRSPFAGYQYGLLHYETSAQRSPEYLAAGIVLAGGFGDPMAPELQRRFAARHPDLNGSLLLQFVSTAYRLVQLARGPSQ